jgi:hypothetical protein
VIRESFKFVNVIRDGTPSYPPHHRVQHVT